MFVLLQSQTRVHTRARNLRLSRAQSLIDILPVIIYGTKSIYVNYLLLLFIPFDIYKHFSICIGIIHNFFLLNNFLTYFI